MADEQASLQPPAPDPGVTRHINALDLTLFEHDVLVIMLGAGMGQVITTLSPVMARTSIIVTNKLLAGTPNFTPYEEDIDMKNPWPLKRKRPQ